MEKWEHVEIEQSIFNGGALFPFRFGRVTRLVQSKTSGAIQNYSKLAFRSSAGSVTSKRAVALIGTKSPRWIDEEVMVDLRSFERTT